MTKMRVLWQSNSTHSCFGYGVLTRNVVSRLRKNHGHDIICQGCQTIGKAITDEEGNINLPIRQSPFGITVLNAYIKTYEINTLITAWDYFVDEGKSLVDIVKDSKIRWISHATINTFPINPILRERLSHADLIIAPSEYNYGLLRNAGLGAKTVYIPHGVDLKKYKKANPEEKDLFKKGFWEHTYSQMKDKFVFFCVNRNKGTQKNFYGMFESIAYFKDKFPELFNKCVWLFLCDFNERGGEDIDGYLNHFQSFEAYKDIKSHIINVFCRPKKEDITKLKAVSNLSQNAFCHFANFAIEEDEMNKLYNISDCFISTTMNESAGLPILEAQACGLPIIMTRGSTCGEYVVAPKTGIDVPVAFDVQTGVGICKKGYVNTAEFANAMGRMVVDTDFRKKCSDNTQVFIKPYDWNEVVKLWDKILSQVNVVRPVDYSIGLLGV